MRKKLSLLLLLLLIPTLVYAWGVMIVGGGVSAGGFTWEISETFENLDDWTDRVGTYTITSNQLDPPADGSFTSCDTTLNTDTVVYAKVELISNTYQMKLVVRSDTSGDGYVVTFDNDGDTVTWSDMTSWAQDSAIETDTSITQDGSEWIAVSVTGTGASTVLSYWVSQSDPGDYGSWGAATGTMESNPPQIWGDSGTTVGCGCYGSTGLLDNFYAGSSS